MFLQWLWFGMMGASILYACAAGTAGQVLPAALGGTADAVALSLRLLGGYLFFCGLIEIVKALKVPQALSRMLRPVLRLILPQISSEQTMEAVTLNLTANLLGLGNAATPMGIRAMSLMDEEQQTRPAVRHAMYMLLIVNATSIQLLPTTVLTLRAAAGSAAPETVILPGLYCSALSTAVGVALGMLCRRRKADRTAFRRKRNASGQQANG